MAALVWSSRNAAVATVVEGTSGAATITAVGLGQTQIVATFDGVTATVSVTVTAAVATSIGITPPMPSLAVGTELDLTATATMSDGTTSNVTADVEWSSSDATKATVNAAGRLRGVATGASTLTAKLGSLTATVNATITGATLRSIAVTPANLSLPRGRTQQMTATGTFTDNSTQNLTSMVTWASSNIGNATVSDAAGSKGVLTGANVGGANISATLNGISGQVAVDITAAVLVSIAVTPVDTQLARGLTRELTATGTYSDNTMQNLSDSATWASSDTGVATMAGRVATAVTVGDTVISATQDGVTGSTELEVIAAALVSIAVTPAATTVVRGLNRQMTATGTFTDDSTQDLTGTVTWASSDTGLVQVSNADGSRGLAAGIAVGTATVSATQGGVTGSTSLEVIAAQLVSIEITPAETTLAAGGTRQLTATGTFTDDTLADITNDVSWSSSDAAVATISTDAAPRGVLTAVSAGSATITAAMGAVSDTAAVTVTDAVLVSLEVTPAVATLADGLTLQYAATGTFSDDSTSDLTAQVTWSSSNTDRAQISNAAGEQGLATARDLGAVTITATLNAISDDASLEVTAAVVTAVNLTPAVGEVPVGRTLQLNATAVFSNGDTQEVTDQAEWSSSNPGFATVSNSGGRGLVTAVAVGAVTITASFGGFSDSAGLEIVAPVLDAIAIAPVGDLMRGTSKQLVATGTFSDGTTADVTSLLSWSSSNAAAITVDDSASKGLVTALTTAGATITAVFDDALNATVAIAGCKLLVNEVQTFSTVNASDEFVEVLPTCTTTQNLAGLRLVYRAAASSIDTGLLTLSGTIDPGQHLFYVNTGFAANYTGEAGTFGTSMSATGGGVGVLRVGTGGAIIDSMGFGGATNAFVETAAVAAHSNVQSLARVPDGSDTDDNSVDFVATTTRTPGAPNVAAAPSAN